MAGIDKSPAHTACDEFGHGAGLRTDRTAQTIIAGHAFVQNLRRGHYELAIDNPPGLRAAAAFTELAI
jgi:hypothetical protein